MTVVRPATLIVAVLLNVALGLATPAAASPRAGTDPLPNGARHVEVATYNVDFGTNLAPLFTITDPVKLMSAANSAYQAMIASNYSERANAIADLIAKERPDMVGLQEIATWETLDLTRPQLDFVVAHDFLPTAKVMMTADRTHKLALELGIGRIAFVGNRATSPDDVDRMEAFAAERGCELLIGIPEDGAVPAADRASRCVLDTAPDSEAVRAIGRLAERLEGQFATTG